MKMIGTLIQIETLSMSAIAPSLLEMPGPYVHNQQSLDFNISSSINAIPREMNIQTQENLEGAQLFYFKVCSEKYRIYLSKDMAESYLKNIEPTITRNNKKDVKLKSIDLTETSMVKFTNRPNKYTLFSPEDERPNEVPVYIIDEENAGIYAICFTKRDRQMTWNKIRRKKYTQGRGEFKMRYGETTLHNITRELRNPKNEKVIFVKPHYQ